MDKNSLYRPHDLPEPIQLRGRPAPSAQFPTIELVRPHPRLRRLQQWIAERSALHLTLKDAAGIAGLEPHYFSHTFHQLVGISFGEWMRKHRAAIAIEALESGQYSIDRVAEFVGYQGRRSLERSVRRSTGKTPAEIQRKTEIELLVSCKPKRP